MAVSCPIEGTLYQASNAFGFYQVECLLVKHNAPNLNDEKM